jgi:hypothetical protein
MPELAEIAGLLPVSRLPLRAAALPFAGGNEGAAAAVVIGVRQPAFANRVSELLTLDIHAFTPDGQEKARVTRSVRIDVPAALQSEVESRYEAITTVELPGPGRYELRIAVHSATTDTRGSIYLDLDVPDIRRQPLSLSGLVIRNGSGLKAGAAGLSAFWLQPTTERSFKDGEGLVASALVYLGEREKVGPVAVSCSVVGQGQTASQHTVTISSESFGGAVREAGFVLRLESPRAGDFELVCRATKEGVAVERRVAFAVR